MGKTRQEKIATVVSVGVLVAAAWFWALQVGDVIEVLSMAYG
jgi:hypothetical protein